MMAEPPSKKPKMEKVKDETGGSSRATVAGESSRTVDVGGFGEPDISGRGMSTFLQIELSSEDLSFIVKSYAFVDKTLLIKTFYPEKGNIKKVLITAPHRFGKSVNMNMLKTFFEIVVDKKGNPMKCVKKNEAGRWIEDEGETTTENFLLFKNNNLKIYQCQCQPRHTEEQMRSGECASRQYFYEHCGQHPVLFVSFKNLCCKTWDKFLSSFRILLNYVFMEYNYLQSSNRLSQDQKEYFDRYASDSRFESLSEEQILNGLKKLVCYLYKHFNNKKVIVLIDEFDAPIMKLIHASDGDLAYIEEVVGFFRSIVSDLFKGNQNVFGGLINACVLLSTVLSSDANNVQKCQFLELHEFSEFYGFTKPEVKEVLKRPRFTGVKKRAILNYYNGYIVGRKRTKKLYNVYSTVNYLKNWSLEQQTSGEEYYKPRNYWIQDHGIENLQKLFGIEEIRKAILKTVYEGPYKIDKTYDKLTPEDILQLKNLIVQYNKDPLEHQVDLFLFYLKDRGYFNITKRERHCELSIPNDEIRDEFIRLLCDKEYYKKTYKFTPQQITGYCNALLSLDVKKPETLEELANSIEQLYSKEAIMPTNHAEFACNLFTFARGIEGLQVNFEKRCVPRRNFKLDLLIYREEDRTGIIMEFKWGSKENAEKGLKQIFVNQYYEAFREFDIDNKMYIGMHFSELKKVSICAASTDDEEWDDVKKNIIRYPE